MCGIAGEFVFTGDRQLIPDELLGMIDALAHRGPDSAGYYLNDAANMLLMHSRTPRVDPSGGSQPLCNETGSIWISFNGEIYDHRLQIANLKATGHYLQSRCDAEVIPHLFEDHGTESFAKLRGEFAFAVHNEHTRSLYLVRDRLGSKPLHYVKTADSVVFASEAKALFRHPRVRAQIDRETIGRLLFGITTPDSSIFQGVRQVKPAHYLEIGKHGLRERPYWKLSFENVDPNRSMDDAAEEFRHIFDEAVKLRLDADVQIGTYLSGGLDSALVLESMARQYKEPIETFTIRFSNDASDEAYVAAQTASHFGVANTPVDVSEQDLIDRIEATIWHTEVPQMNSHSAAKYVLSERSCTTRKAVLTGSGADEFFIGYGMYSHQLLLDQNKQGGNVNSQINAMLRRENVPPGTVRARTYRKWGMVNNMFGSYPYQALRALTFEYLIGHYLSPDIAENPNATGALRYLARWLPDQDALKGCENWRSSQYLKITCDLPWYVMSSMDDRPEMAHAMEGRTPFVDKELIDFATRLPGNLLFNEQRGKLLLRHALKGRLPETVLQGHTKLFWTPTAREKAVLRSPLMRHYLSSSVTRDVGVFHPSRISMAHKVLRIMPAGSKTAAVTCSLLMSAASLHMLHDMYEKNFQDAYKRFPAKQRIWNVADIRRHNMPADQRNIA